MLDYIRETLELMQANLTRTVLTLVGLVVGVAAIISIQVAAAGMAAAVNGAFRGINMNTFFIFPKSTQGSTQRANLGLSDLTLLDRNVPGVETAIPFGQTRTIVNAGHQHVMLKFGGESYRRFSTAPIVAGHAITRSDVENATPVCVLSSKAYDRLFPHAADPETVLGQSVYVGPKRYVVVGILGPATLSTASLGFDINNDVVIPYTTFYNDYQRGRPLFGIQVLGSRNANLATLEADAKRVLSEAHNLSDFRTLWIETQRRRQLIEHLLGADLNPDTIREIDQMREFDLFDFFGHHGYKARALKQQERGELYVSSNENWFAGMTPNAATVLRCFGNQFSAGGTEALETTALWDVPEIRMAGGMNALRSIGSPAQIMLDAKGRLFGV